MTPRFCLCVILLNVFNLKHGKCQGQVAKDQDQLDIQTEFSRVFQSLKVLENSQNVTNGQLIDFQRQLKDLRDSQRDEFLNLKTKFEKLFEVMKQTEDKAEGSSGRNVSKAFNGKWDNCRETSCVRELLKEYNQQCLMYRNRQAVAEWQYWTNMTDANSKLQTEVDLETAAWAESITKFFRRLKQNSVPGLSMKEKRILNMLSKTAQSSNSTIRKQLSKLENQMAEIYSSGTVVYNGTRQKKGEAGVVPIFKNIRNCSALASVWKQWRDSTGKKMRSKYTEMVKLQNIGARENNFRDIGYYEWFIDYKDPRFDQKVMDQYKSISPLYKEFHAYVRYKLKQFYPDCIDENGPIPSHLLGDVWAQSFDNIYDILIPYPDVEKVKVDEIMITQGWTVDKMFKTAEDFFVSLGFPNMTKKFWTHSMFTRPENRTVDCHASAWDFAANDDFRVMMCTTVTKGDFITVHHEMGHIVYDMAYTHQPCIFQDGANSGFHEAIGDTISKAVKTNAHLKKMKFLQDYRESEERDINHLVKEASDAIAFLPFALLMDTWRWRVFNGSIKPDTYNEDWWKLRLQLQGLAPPIERSEEDFDPGSKYHIAFNVNYIRYFTSYIMQFQFYEAMCNASGHQGPIFNCDFYNSKEAGRLLKSVLSLGASKPWPEAMKLMTGQTEISLEPMKRYFKPLMTWLTQYRKKKGYAIGW